MNKAKVGNNRQNYTSCIYNVVLIFSVLHIDNINMKEEKQKNKSEWMKRLYHMTVEDNII